MSTLLISNLPATSNLFLLLQVTFCNTKLPRQAPAPPRATSLRSKMGGCLQLYLRLVCDNTKMFKIDHNQTHHSYTLAFFEMWLHVICMGQEAGVCLVLKIFYAKTNDNET